MALLVDTASQKPCCSEVNILNIPRCCFNPYDITISITFENPINRETGQ